MPAVGPAMIGPNAVLQTAWAMERHIGAEATREVLEIAGVLPLPAGDAMIAEADALRLHHALAALHPDEAEAIVMEAGEGTADYIIVHRIPWAAAWALRRLPAPIAARLLMKAIAGHAWTFIGAGTFTVTGPWHFTIDRAAAGDAGGAPPTLFLWYAAVFARLYATLVRSGSGCTGGAPDPRFPYRWHYRIAPVKAGAAPVRVVRQEQAAIRPAPAPMSAARRRPASPALPTSRAASRS